MHPFIPKPNMAPIHIGQITICPGYHPETMQPGWILPGCGFTASRERASEVAFIMYRYSIGA